MSTTKVLKINKDTKLPEEICVFHQKHGNSAMARSALQNGCSVFLHSHLGYIGFMKKWCRIYPLSDPICAPENKKLLLQAFLKKYRKICFVQVNQHTKDILTEIGFYSTQLGIEIWFDLTEYNPRDHKELRRILNKENNRGYKLELLNKKQHIYEKEMVRIKASWLNSRVLSHSTMKYLVREEAANEEYTETFGVFDEEDHLLSYVICDTLFDGKKATGSNINITHYTVDDNSWSHINRYTILKVIEYERERKRKFATLGLSPFTKIEREGSEHKFLFDIFKYMYEKGENIYPAKRLYTSKREYHGEERKTYCVSNSPLPFIDLLNVLKLSDLKIIKFKKKSKETRKFDLSHLFSKGSVNICSSQNQ